MSMRKRIRMASTAAICAVGLIVVSSAMATRGGRGNAGVVYVIGQGLYFDTFVTTDPLPPEGPFQRLYPAGVNGPTASTQYGPGDPGYLGGRWWVDENGNDMMDEEDHYFLCPLLPPGREQP